MKSTGEIDLCSWRECSDADLLRAFLHLPRRERTLQFADTCQAAHLVGVSRRTIQLWIETGNIRAVRLGKRYQVLLDSVYSYLGDCLAC